MGRGGPRAQLRSEEGRGAKTIFWSPCWAHHEAVPPHDVSVSGSPFCIAPAPRPHHARTTPHRRDQASVLHGGCELKGHLCDLGTQALVSCGMAQSTRRRYGRGRQPKQPEHHAAAARLTHPTATIRTHASKMPISSVDCGHVRLGSSSHTSILAVKPWHLHLHRPNPTPRSRCSRQKITHRTNAKPRKQK